MASSLLPLTHLLGSHGNGATDKITVRHSLWEHSSHSPPLHRVSPIVGIRSQISTGRLHPISCWYWANTQQRLVIGVHNRQWQKAGLATTRRLLVIKFIFCSANWFTHHPLRGVLNLCVSLSLRRVSKVCDDEYKQTEEENKMTTQEEEEEINDTFWYK